MFDLIRREFSGRLTILNAALSNINQVNLCLGLLYSEIAMALSTELPPFSIPYNTINTHMTVGWFDDIARIDENRESAKKYL